MRLLVLLFILFLVSDSAFSQMEAKLDSIQVTASRISTTVSESGKTVSVITQQQIQQLPVTSVDELLRTLPGMSINTRQGFGVQSDVGMRGSTYSQVLFMLDNVPLNDPLTGHFNANIPVSLSEIGQIEIVRGPASASFGSDAVGGVIHIKTKMYMEREVQIQNGILSYLHADLAGGQNALYMGDLSLQLQMNRLTLGASFRTIQSDGERLPNPGFDASVSDQETYDNYFGQNSASVSLAYRLGQGWNFYTRAGMDERDFSARYFYTRSQFDESVEEITNKWVISALTRESGNHRSELNASFRQVSDTFDFNSRIGIPANEHTTQHLYLNLSHQIETGSNDRLGVSSSRLMIGAQMTGKNIESTDRGNHEDNMGGIYLISNYAFENGLNLTTSGRIQFDSNGSTDFLPQISTSYTTGQVTFRTSAGRAIRVGDYTERYISSLIPNLTPGRNIGNPDLKPERSVSVDGGLDWRPAPATRISPTVFYRNSSNLIDYIFTNSNDIDNADNLQPNENYFYAQNISRTETAGFELMISQAVITSTNHSINLDAGYTYIHTGSSSGEVSKYIANHPSHQVTLGARFRVGGFMIHSQNEYRVRSEEFAQIIGAEVPSDYFISNLNMEYKPSSIPVVIYSRILNLTDTQYQEILGAPMPGRWVLGGLRVLL